MSLEGPDIEARLRDLEAGAEAEAGPVEITREEIQRWVDSLDDRRQAYLEWLMLRVASRAEIDAAKACVDFCLAVGAKYQRDRKPHNASYQKGEGAKKCGLWLAERRLHMIETAEKEGLG